MASKNALYNQDGEQKLMVVVKENSDKTVDLARAEGSGAIVTSCVVSDSPLSGQCSVGHAADLAAKKAKRDADDAKEDAAEAASDAAHAAHVKK